MPLGLKRFPVLVVGLTLWLITLFSIPNTFDVISDYFSFLFLGVLGAIFANSTGAGGGVVFIPMFNQLGFTELQAVATSFTIQCFGMTAGALTWCAFYRREKAYDEHWQAFKPIVLVTLLPTILGLWSVYGFDLASPSSLHHVFSIFSIVLGVGILFSVYKIKHDKAPDLLKWYDVVALILIGYFGGIITAWLSVGVGEVMAIYLILRRFDVTMAVASAVVVSAIIVWTSTPQHWLFEPNVYWHVVLFAGPGAVLGGLLARHLVARLSARRLKVFFALWVLIVGIATL
ncbi:sulfite exporter TauE/SafE family protein [Catenovulum sp. SM1970]|nr:sulfite exporter TauE/SafE family protein [Marinifaba aquimaris]